jgi:hypothetical protein
MLERHALLGAHFRAAHLDAFLARAAAGREFQIECYANSRREGTDYHRAYDAILANQSPGEVRLPRCDRAP